MTKTTHPAINPDIGRAAKKRKGNSWLKGLFSKPETLVFFLMLAVLAFLLITTEDFRDARYIVKAVSRNVEFGLISLMLTFVIIAGMIDLSIASTMTLSAMVAAILFQEAGLPMAAAIVFGLAAGFLLGLLNGVLVAYAGIAPIIVTIATLSLYRGIAQIFIGDHSLGQFPAWFNGVDRIYAFNIGDAKIPITVVGLLIVAAIMFMILKYTTIGRKIYAIGTNERAALYVGVNVKRFKLMIFGFTGLFCAAAGLLTMSRLLVVRHDIGLGGELDMVTIVILGGTSFLGGKGNIIGTLCGLLIVVFVKSGLSVAGVKVDQQLFALGALLLLSIIIPELVSLLKEWRLGRMAQRQLDEDRATPAN